MKAMFFHGLMSTPDTSRTAKAVREFLARKDVEVVVPDYQPQTRSYDEIDAFLRKEVQQLLDGDDEVMLIGISLGGYWALKMTNELKYVSHCILINPSLNYYGKPVEAKWGFMLTVITNADDDVVDNRETQKRFKGRAECIEFPSGGHRPTNMDQILPLIEKCLYTINL